MLGYIVFFFYLILFCYFVFIITKKHGLVQFPILFVIAFIFKVLFGCLYGKYYTYQIPQADTWNYFFNGLKLNQSHWKGVFKTPSDGNFNLLSPHSYFNYYRYLFLDIYSGFCSLLTGGRYYCNVIFYNFSIFVGLLQLYRFLIKFSPAYKTIFFCILFFFPPFVFWTSGFHRDGLLIAFLGIFLYSMQKCCSMHRLMDIVLLFLSLALLIFMRFFWGFSAIIIGVLWFIAVKFRNNLRPCPVFTFGGIGGVIIFALSALAPNGLNFAESLVEKQHAFLALNGLSELGTSRLSLNPISFVKVLLEGYNHLLLRPYPREIAGAPLYLLAFIENLFVLLLAGLSFFFVIKRENRGGTSKPVEIGTKSWDGECNKVVVLSKPENNVLLFLVILNYSIVGITVPFLGAIVRYKAPFELLLIILLIQYVPVEFLRKLVPKRIRKYF